MQTSLTNVPGFIIGTCPGEMIFELNMKKCYQVITRKLSHSKATRYCRHIFPGVHLVDLLSDEEQTAVTSLVEAADPPGRYLDMRYINTLRLVIGTCMGGSFLE